MSHSLFRQNLRSIMLCSFAWFLFSVLDALTKYYTQTYSVIQLLAMSSITGVLLAGGWILFRYGWRGFITKNWKLFTLRGLLIVVGAYATLKSISLIDLADFYGIVFISPFLVTIMSALILEETIGIHRIVALVIGFAGVIILAGPRLESDREGILWVLAATCIGSLSTIIIRKIGREKVSAIFAFVPALFTMMVYVPLSLATPETLYIPQNPWALAPVFLLGILSFFGFLAYSYGLTRASQTAVISPFHYTQMIWGVLFGFFMFGNIPALTTIIGSVIILSAGLYLLWREYVHHKVNHSNATIVTASGEATLPEV